ncbi:UPF0193 protein EVG1 homolog [Macrosteles quadrilineatus]|uniref:UPF0193 protein EVG1 homolog n=1 Tax=Macrosteles quadrilineatus TaxID=74068 RepID=UPI0023E1F325|nr:UPF0193 protein EVG1 homolog [Macrosteles quadrilineatus]
METREHRVGQGGLFHSHKVKYSKDTQDLIHRLIEESKLSILQRQTLRESVNRGEPLPGPTPHASTRSHSASTLKNGEMLVPPALPRRRSYQAIVKSGAYQRDPFDPPFNVNMKNRDVEKQKLQSLMTYGKELPPDHLDVKEQLKLRRNTEKQDPDADAVFDHLVEEVRERLEFLHEMEGLGQAKAYQTVIEQEVAAKMRQMAKLDQEKFLGMSGSLEGIRSAVKPAKRNTTCNINNIFPHD